MSHDHRPCGVGTYRLEQVLTIGTCGALAGVLIMDWYSGKLGYFIKDKYFLLVLTGALLLLALVIVRAVAVWLSVEEPPLDTYDHPYSHHGWAPCRYVVLLFPVALSFLMPLDGRSGGSDEGAFNVRFGRLVEAAGSEDLRSDYEGKTVRLAGRFYHLEGDRFCLRRGWWTAAGRFEIGTVIVLVDFSRSNERLLHFHFVRRWVEVTGRVEFLPGDGDRFIPALVIQPTPDKKLTSLVRIVPAPTDPFIDD
jgi:hypothetical protein